MIVVRLREAMDRFRRSTGRRITYKRLAEKCGVSESTLQSIAARRDYNTTLDTVDRIAVALDCPLDVLLEHVPVVGFTTEEPGQGPQRQAGVLDAKGPDGPQD